MYCRKYVVYLKISTIFSKNVHKQCFHACDFFHLWLNTKLQIIMVRAVSVFSQGHVHGCDNAKTMSTYGLDKALAIDGV